MIPYKHKSARQLTVFCKGLPTYSVYLLRMFSWLCLLLLVSGVSTGAAQTIERALNGASIFPDNHGKGEPGATVIYTHTLRNVGSGVDTFDLTISSSAGWSAVVSPDVVTLKGQEETPILVTIVVGANAQQGDMDVTTVTATSQNDPSITDSAVNTTVVPVPMFFPLMVYEAGEPLPDCPLVVPPPANPPGVDLVVTAVSLTPAAPQAGQPVTVRVTVKNQGMGNVTPGNNFLIDFYVRSLPLPPGPFQPGTIFWGVQGADFTAGSSHTLVSTHTFNHPGFYYLYAQIDTDKNVAEANENNNIYGCLEVAVN